MASREPVPWTRFVLDTNRLRRRTQRDLVAWDGNRLNLRTQRQFHATVQEIRSGRLMTVPGAALEMVPLLNLGAPDWGRGRIVEEIEERRTQGHGRRGHENVHNAEMQLWWLDEWSRPDGIYGFRELNDHEVERYEALMADLPLEAFEGVAERESLRTLVDARIVCETLAVDGILLLTHDPGTIKPEKLLPWTQALADADWISHPDAVQEADKANSDWFDTSPADMLLATILCAWPLDTDATTDEVRQRVDDLIKRLARGRLKTTSTKLKALVSNTDHLDDIIEETREWLPGRMHEAERRRPHGNRVEAKDRVSGPTA